MTGASALQPSESPGIQLKEAELCSLQAPEMMADPSMGLLIAQDLICPSSKDSKTNRSDRSANPCLCAGVRPQSLFALQGVMCQPNVPNVHLETEAGPRVRGHRLGCAGGRAADGSSTWVNGSTTRGDRAQPLGHTGAKEVLQFFSCDSSTCIQVFLNFGSIWAGIDDVTTEDLVFHNLAEKHSISP